MPKSTTPRRSTSTYVTKNAAVNEKAATKKKKKDASWSNTSTEEKKKDFDKTRRVLVGDKPRATPKTFGTEKTSAPSTEDLAAARRLKAKKAKAKRTNDTNADTTARKKTRSAGRTTK